jgi:SPX domain protein involved in polyphosphate accumulation
MDNHSSEFDSYRYERKFTVSDLTRQEIELLVKLNTATFVTHYPPRYVNSLYLDSADLENYFDNLNGHKERLKVRIRWYGNLFGLIKEPTLELKFKNGSLGRKESFALKPFSLDEPLQINAIRQAIRESILPDHVWLHLYAVEQTVVSRYMRQYYVSANRKCRITIDSELIYYQHGVNSSSFPRKSTDRANTVVELKYSPDEEQHMDQITAQFPFRMTRSSKYVSGIERLAPW